MGQRVLGQKDWFFRPVTKKSGYFLASSIGAVARQSPEMLMAHLANPIGGCTAGPLTRFSWKEGKKRLIELDQLVFQFALRAITMTCFN
jgi:hypothetical protein